MTDGTRWDFNNPTQPPSFSAPPPTADIGKPSFKLEVSEDGRTTRLYVADPLTALFRDGRQLNMRDVFADKLMYRVTYRRNKSTGKVRRGRGGQQTLTVARAKEPRQEQETKLVFSVFCRRCTTPRAA